MDIVIHEYLLHVAFADPAFEQDWVLVWVGVFFLFGLLASWFDI
jgi:hypothetical protein